MFNCYVKDTQMILNKNVKIALIQDSPVFLNLQESIIKAETLINQAADEGAKIIVFPETWLTGYPIWLDNAKEAAMWNHSGAKILYKILYQNSVIVAGKEVAHLRNVAENRKIILVMGCHEVDRNTLYNTIVYLPGDGGDIKVHRKLIPTYNEKLIWGCGDGSTLNTIESEYGVVGGLICWEHWMPLARAAMHSKKEVIHIAQWPSVIELHQMASRHYAFEGRCFVLACGGVLTLKDVLEGFDSLNLDEPEARNMLKGSAISENDFLMTGGSCVIGPDASYLAEPVFKSKKTTYATLDPDLIDELIMTLDTDGHYSRPDIFSLNVNETPQRNVRFFTDD